MVGLPIQSSDDYASRRLLVLSALAGDREEPEFYFLDRIEKLAGAAPTLFLLDPTTNPYEIAIQVPAVLTEADPVDAIVATDDGAGAIEAGTYQYKAIYLFSEGNTHTAAGDSESNEVTIAGSRKIEVTLPVSPSPDCVARVLYRRQDPSSAYHLVTAIWDNYTATYEDNYPHATVVGNPQMPTDNTTETLLKKRLEDLIRRTKPAHIKHTLTGAAFLTDYSLLDQDPL